MDAIDRPAGCFGAGNATPGSAGQNGKSGRVQKSSSQFPHNITPSIMFGRERAILRFRDQARKPRLAVSSSALEALFTELEAVSGAGEIVHHSSGLRVDGCRGARQVP